MDYRLFTDTVIRYIRAYDRASGAPGHVIATLQQCHADLVVGSVQGARKRLECAEKYIGEAAPCRQPPSS